MDNIVGVIYLPEKTFRFVTNSDSKRTISNASTWTAGPKINSTDGRRRNRVSIKSTCSICFESDITVYKCPNMCKTLTCIDCIVMYCSTNDLCGCYNCKYEYSCIDIGRMCWERKDELIDIKCSKFVQLYDRYINITEKKIDISYDLQNEWQLSDEMGDALVFDENPPEGTDTEWWSDIKDIWNKRTAYEELLKTNYVDICSNCNGGILPDSWKCIRCTSIMCSSCGICHNDKDHKCSKTDIESRKEVIMNSKPCPHCSARIYKAEGCDIMWCTVCKVRFAWDTMKIIEKNMHNPEHTSFLIQFYDNIKLRHIRDFNTEFFTYIYLSSGNLRCRYNKTFDFERHIVKSITTHIVTIIRILIIIHANTQLATDISPNKYEDERLRLVVGEWNKEQYISEMKNRAKTCFMNRYFSLYCEYLIRDLSTLCIDYLDRNNYSNELLYEQFCLKISAYNKDFCYIHNILYSEPTTDILYRLLYNTPYNKEVLNPTLIGNLSDNKAYYDVKTGIIIPIATGSIPDKLHIRPAIRSVISTV